MDDILCRPQGIHKLIYLSKMLEIRRVSLKREQLKLFFKLAIYKIVIT